MRTHSGSVLQKLSLGFGLAALVIVGLMALFMDRALQHSLETEDAQVMEDQARALLAALTEGKAPSGSAPQLEKAEWRVVDAAGRLVAQSPGMARIPTLPWPRPSQAPREVEGPQGSTYSVLVRAWPRGDASPEGLLLLALDRSHEEALVKGFRRVLAISVALAAVLAALVGRLIAAWGLAPLRQIAREAGAIDDRSLDRRLHGEHFPSELQDLVGTLNGALDRLQTAFAHLEHLGAELAHELRTPLQNLRSTLENLTLGETCTETQRTALGGLLEDCDRMARLIEQILFLARTQREPLTPGLGWAELDAQELLEETRSFFEAAAEEAGVVLQVVSQPPAPLQGNRLLLLRALHNLTANALRHAPQAGHVSLGVTPNRAEIVLWVEDDGPGIPKDWIPKLGRPFVRGPGTEGKDGLGLGLAIVARVAAMHGGTMAIQSTVGEGTRVSLCLPVP